MHLHRFCYVSFGLLFGLLLFALGAQPAYADGPIFVKPTSSGSADGSSWDNAATLQAALTSASAGDEIWVATGVYTPGLSATASFALVAGAGIYGGFAATETLRTERDWLANPTVLSGDIGGDDLTDANGVVTDTANITGTNNLHVVFADGATTPITGTTVLDGFSITAGNATEPTVFGSQGGGFYCNGADGALCSPHLENILFTGNKVIGRGGAMVNFGDAGESSPTLVNVVFSNNVAGVNAGAMFNDGGGGASSPSLVNVTFYGNSAEIGGAMFNEGNGGESSPTLVNVVFSGNVAELDGGAVYNATCGSGPSFVNVTFSGNVAARNGGAIYNIGGRTIETAIKVTFDNVILWGNSATISGTQMYNKIAQVTFTSNLVQGGITGAGVVNSTAIITDGGGNIDGDPLFVDAAHHDLRLSFGSPAIDAGDNDAIAQAIDLQGSPRKIDGDGNGTVLVDIGALEAPVAYGVSVVKVGNGSGEVAHSPDGLTCTAPCIGLYRVGSAITLTATDHPESTFSGWSGDCASVTPCHLIVDAAKQVTATFSLNSYPLTVNTAGNGSGTVSKQPDQPNYLFGTVVTLTATAASGSTFSGWSGDCAGPNPCIVTIDSSNAVTATFTLESSPETHTPNHAPGFTSSAGLTATVGLTYTYSVTASDPDSGDIMTLTAPIMPTWLTLTPTGNGTATLSGTPAAANVGANPVQLRVQDKAGAFATQSFTITVATVTEPITETGSVQGHVQDEQGNGLAGASVALTDESGAVAIASLLTQSTNSSGDYLFEEVPVGDYTITIQLDGMEPSAPSAVSVVAGQITTVPTITLQPSVVTIHLPMLGKSIAGQ